MAEVLTWSQLRGLLQALAQDMAAQKDRLNQLDGAAGDGDLGISLSRGFDGLIKALPEETEDIGKTLAQGGFAFGEAAGSTIGALMSAALMRAGKAAQGKTEVDLPALAAMARAAEDGIRARGKAELGKKTLLDALVPAVDALEAAAKEGTSFAEAFERATKAAEAGVEATKSMTPTVGRARWMPERSLGHEDPGAVAIAAMFQSLTNSLRGMSK